MKALTITSLVFACSGILMAQEAPRPSVTVPSGTQVQVRLGQTISSATNKVGDAWTGTVAQDVVIDGNVVAHRGDPVEGKVADARSSGRLSGKAELGLQLTSINGQTVDTAPVTEIGKGHTGRNVKAAGGGAVLGAIIGGLAGGGKGAAIGAGAGAAAGTGGAAATGKKDVKYPVESILTFTIR